ncbi:MAG: hypothetical protein AAF333_18425 [Planctomycetota bacterium]
MPLPGTTPALEAAPQPRSGLGPALLWACFLGCSWTWVIGMFLPIMLLRDFGVWGWVVFAVPNMLGAAAMGTVLARPEVSWNLVQKHPGALRWFAGITIAYQIYVVFWLFNYLWLAVIWVVPWLVMDKPRREALGAWLPTIGVGVAVLSWGAFSMAESLDGAWLDVSTDTLPSRLTALDLWILAPGLVTGFFLCPYLDPTFHRARYSTGPGTGKIAFAVGFGVVFASMIVFTLMYAGLMRPVINGEPGAADTITSPWKVLLAIHIGIQVAFTLLVHARERFAVVEKKDRWPLVWFGLVMLGALGWAVVSRTTGIVVPTHSGHDLTLGEAGYRAFLLIYGVFFPAYVLICMIPTLRSGHQPSLAARRKVFWVASIVSYPLAMMGLIVGPMIWLLGLYGTLAAGRVVVELWPASGGPSTTAATDTDTTA